jgi:putative transposase
LGGLSKLSVWLIKLGIQPERIQPSHPQENGRHERMHRTLKAATAKPPQKNHRQQQRAFDQFRQEYNQERPHESLGMQTPSDYYKPSLRGYPVRIAEIKYPGSYQVRQVRHNWEIKWKGEKVYVSQALAREPVALRQREKHIWEVYYSSLSLGMLDELEMNIQRKESPKEGEKVLTMCPV